ncbi:MAG: YlbF family regulator [Huintestinicola sp.]
MSKVIELARELGKALQEDPAYNSFITAKAANECDTELQKMIMRFQEAKADLDSELTKKDKDTEKIKALDSEMRELYDSVMKNEHMVAFDKAQSDMDDILNSIQFIITTAANGGDPLTCPETAPQTSCTGSCSTCGGCH